MAEPSEFKFDFQEVATLLIKQQDLHEGKWVIGFEFGLGAGNFGATQADAKPTAFVQVQKITLSLVTSQTSALPFVVDAAVVNPPPKGARKSTKKA